ncbi:hypothetical protein [Sphingobacterium sp.]|uniref:hypothetical protein n=1 Tax=Sphingobacterium sp. TaxID=341027 RepID=UPI002FDE12E7
MTVYEAIKQMRDLSKKGEPFSFTFASYSKTKDSSDGNIHVSRGLLRKRDSEANNQYADCQESYTNLDTGEPRRFWQCCLLVFNGQTLTIS